MGWVISIKFNLLFNKSVVATMSLLVSLWLCGSAAPQSASMETDSLYTINTAADLYAFAKQVNSGTSFEGKTVKLQQDIVLNDTAHWQHWDTLSQAPKLWEPIGTKQHPFKGVFDGQHHTVSGLFIHTGTEGMFQGLFGVIARATIKNTGVTASYIRGYDHVGAVVGYMKEGSILDGCFNSATVRANRSIAGGVVGRAEGTNVVVNCYNQGLVMGSRHVGGVIGCFQNGSLYNCYNKGEVKGRYENTGGIVGSVIAEYDANESRRDTLANCFNTGPIIGRDVVGGIVGYMALMGDGKRHRGTYVANCYSAGKLRSLYPMVVDGLVGLYSMNMDTADIDDTLANDEKIVIERYGDSCYWSQESCKIAKLDRPRFARYARSDQWRTLILNQTRKPDVMIGLSAQKMQAAAFIAALNRWVEKHGHLFKHWALDGLNENKGFPVFRKEERP